MHRRISVSVLGGENMTGKFENSNFLFFQDASHLYTFCARAVERIDQFVVFYCVCTWLPFSSFFDTC